MKKKRKLKIKNILVAVLIVCTLSGIIVYTLKGNKKETKSKDIVEEKVDKKEENILKNYTITKKIGEDLPSVLDYIEESSSDTKINWNNLKHDNNKLYNSGIFKGVIEYNDKKYDVELVVVDDEKPTISGVKDLTIYVGDKIDFFSSVTISDNSYDEVSKTISGTYDTNKVGTYQLKYVITDKSNNTLESSFNLIVKQKESSNSNTNTSSTDKTGTTSKGYKIEKKNGIYYVNGILIANKTYGLPSTYNPGGLTKTFMTAYNKMKADYDKVGFKSYPKLSIRSGFRSYSTQNTLYNNYVKRDGKSAADRYSARPGYSEHQSGLAADLNVVSDTYGDTDSGKWLANNCWKYGFILRYPKGKESQTGYMYESWHFRYIGDVDIAKQLYNGGNWISLEEYLGIDSKYSN